MSSFFSWQSDEESIPAGSSYLFTIIPGANAQLLSVGWQAPQNPVDFYASQNYIGSNGQIAMLQLVNNGS
jgi:hypothetical protein